MIRSQDSEVSIVTGYRLDDRKVGVRVLVELRILSPPHPPGRLWGPLNLLSNWYQGALSPEVKWPGRKTDHSPPASVKVKKLWIYTSTPP
jgi:hypothetical protein